MPSAVVELLKDLIACPSVTPNDACCQDLIATRLEAAGLTIERMPFGDVDNLWATHGSGGPVVCLAGHTDVVPPGPLTDWRSDPFQPTERNGVIYGRGAADMKGSVAAMVVALESLAASGHGGTIALLLTSDEEGPAIDGTRRVLETLVGRGEKIDGVIVGEPTSERVFGDTVKIGRRGSMAGRLVVKGVQGHTAYPQWADNAVHKLAPALAALVAAEWGAGTADFPPTTLQVSNLSGGTGAGNVIPGAAEVRFNIRFGTDWTVEALQTRVAEILSGPDASLELSVSALPFLTEPGPLLRALRGAVQSVTGLAPHASTGGGTSDARFFAARGIPVAEFGPLNATIHAANECVSVSELARLVAVYREAVGAACDGDATK